MWSTSYDIIVETLTGSEFEINVTQNDTIGFIKSKIFKYEGIPVSQQHLLYNHKELSDATEMKDIPLVHGSRLKLVLGMKGGPISSKRIVTISDYENWFDMTDVLSRQDAVNLKTPGLKFLLYKDNKKNVHRLMKVRADKTNSDGVKNSVVKTMTSMNAEKETQRQKDNAVTSEKLHQIKAKMSKLNLRKKKAASPDIDCLPEAITDPKEAADNKTTPSVVFPFLNDNSDSSVFSNVNKIIQKHPDFNKRMQIRENLQRNRSFKTINIKNLDFNHEHINKMERSMSFHHSNNTLSSPITDNSMGGAHASSNGNVNNDSKFSSTSLHDIIEILKYNPTKLRTISNDAINKIVSTTKKQKKSENNSLKNIDEYIRDYDISVNNRINTTLSDYKGFMAKDGTCSQTTLDNAAPGCGLEKPFRSLYKSTSDDNNSYELPKLLIREDSPTVESFHSSYPQLETVALRGESPKNFNTITKIESSTQNSPINSNLSKSNNEKTKLSSGSLLQLYDHLTIENKQNENNWSHHNSDLGINELELKFLNNGLQLPAASNLEINHWNNMSMASYLAKNDLSGKNGSMDSVNNYAHVEDELNQRSSASTNFINSDLSLSSDEDDLFNISDLVYKNSTNKSKSIDLNEFRKTFGSSPTLLNNFNQNYNLVPQLSRLDTIPSQYRRGYTNLNDACLSSSTSDLECVNNGTKKKSSSTDNSDLSPLLKHRNNDHVAYVRSYENLNRFKAFSLKNNDSNNRQQQINCSGGSNDNSENLTQTDSSCSGLNLGDDSFTEFEYKFSKLSCSNNNSNSNCNNKSSTNNNNSSNYYFPSDESLFKMDTFFDVEIDTSDIFESDFINVRNNSNNVIGSHTTSKPTPIGTASSSNLLLPEIIQDDILLKQQQKEINIDGFIIDKHKTDQIKSKKLRCAQCNKKLGVIMIMKCHCEKIFCAQHRYAEAHNCSYNFKMEGKKMLQRDNPQIIAQKLPKI